MNKTTSPVRVRFAPSPTGHLHIGGLRTAIFNWLYARHNNGTFLLRIEDTDLERSKPEYTESILSALQWTNIQSDEPIVIQTERFEQHKKVIEQLLKEKKAYRCYCTAAEIAQRENLPEGYDPEFSKYDRHCRYNYSPSEKRPYVVRFALPEDRDMIQFNDIIRGEVTFDINQFDDFIIARSDGRPMYNFVVVVDDADMKITHIIRGEDHISNTPKQIMLYQACGYAIPQFAHLPLILGSSGQRLSKRDAATSVIDYKQSGYLPDALINYLVRLGWSHGDQEIFSRQELIEYFTLENVGKKGAIFDMAKLGWVNSMYLKEADNKKLLESIKEIRPRFQAELDKFNQEQILALIDLYKQRSTTLIELADEIKSIHDKSTPFLANDISAWVTASMSEQLKTIANNFETMQEFTPAALQEYLKKLSAEHKVKLVHFAQPIRIALVRATAGAGVFELLSILGREESVKRIREFVQFIDENKPLH